MNNQSNIFAFCSNITSTKCEDYLKDKKLDLVPIPLSKSSLTTGLVTGCMQTISSTSKNPERALMFLELVNTDEILSNLINFGIEGVHYKKTTTKRPLQKA